MHPAKEKEHPFLWSQALYLIVRLLSTYVICNALDIKMVLTLGVLTLRDVYIGGAYMWIFIIISGVLTCVGGSYIGEYLMLKVTL